MKTHTIQTAATAVVVLTLVLGMLGTSPSTPNSASHFNISESKSRTDTRFANPADSWGWLLKQPVRVATEQ